MLFNSMLLESFVNTLWFQLITVGAFVLIAIVLIVVSICTKKTSYNTKSIVYAAICIALSFGLSFVKMFHLPYGGSITFLRMLPLIIYAYMFGATRGVLAGIIYGVLDSMVDMYILNPIQYILDYPLPFGLVGLAGLVRNKKYALVFGTLIAFVGRFVPHFLSGVIYFGSYMPADFPIQNVFLYSMWYQLVTVGCDMALVLIAILVLQKSKVFNKELDKVKNEQKLIDQASKST